MRFIDKVFYFFTPYTDAQERAVGGFFKQLTEHSSRPRVQARLATLLQRDIAVINLWTEYRYKGYRYLSKSKRKQLYANLQLITDDFDRFCAQYAQSPEAAIAHILAVAPRAAVDPEKAVHLQTLMDYFSPTRGVYEYRESSSFGRLLRNPTHEKLVGDCNQIVTLYIYLYARQYDIHDLQLRVLPGHVALHYSGVDIETTNGTYTNYHEVKDSKLLPVEEIVSINLLDTTDSYLATHEIAAEDFLQASRFAFILSHDRDIVTQNLEAAYTRLINALLERSNYKRALELAKASGNRALTGIVGHNGAVYEMERHNYAAARQFATVAPNQNELIQASWQAEGVHQYQTRHYHEAIKAFNHSGDQSLLQKCYEALFFEEQAKLAPELSAESIKHYAKNIKRMHLYAKKSTNRQLIEHVNSLSKYL